MDPKELLARVRAQGDSPNVFERLRPQDLPLPAYIKARGPSGVQAYLAAHGIQLALPYVKRLLEGQSINKAFGAPVALPRPPKVLRMAPRTPKLPMPKMGGRPDRIFGQSGTPLLRSKLQ